MKVVIGCDFDPVLPAVLERRPANDIWEASFAGLQRLLDRTGWKLPAITWLLRSDESVRFAAGAYDDAYRRGEAIWSRLRDAGHEIGWHMHVLSYDEARGRFRFDPEPDWLAAAKAALEQHVPIAATRTGWDYGSSFLMSRLDELGVRIDFSALPGNIVWHRLGDETITVDWRNAPRGPYHPNRHDYQRPGPDPLRIVELPVAQFANRPAGMGKRLAWRCLQGCFSLKGLRDKTVLLTTDWNGRLPAIRGDVWSFFFHPEDLTPDGTECMIRNLRSLTDLPGTEFVTAGGLPTEGADS
jgi:hypothetical protein